MKPFSMGYLSGFYADLPDVDYGVYRDKIAQVTGDMAYDVMMSKIKHHLCTYDAIGEPEEPLSETMDIKITGAKTGLFPVWLLSYKNGKRIAYAAVNGSTGKVAADIPLDIGKFLLGCLIGVPHVWNYAQTVAFLFPDLEKTMRNVEFLRETDETGCMSTRMFSVFDQERYAMVPACDGELGSVVRVYRDFKNLGDVEFLKTIWPKVVLAMEYALKQWDLDGDDVLDGQQNTTYDIEFYGPNPMTDSIFLAALKCCEEMAEIVGDEEHHQLYADAYEKGAARADQLMFDGEYYIQVQKEIDKYKYQFGKGCLSDQLLGQFLAYMAGIGEILPKEHVKSAMESVFKYNYKTDFYHTDSVHRAYAINEEHGMVVATWPKGGRPKFPLSYAGEVWTGVEYEVAVNLIYSGCVEEGLTVVKSIRDRYDGYKRNPFSEIESGHHYCRAMASWGVLNALLGLQSDMYRGTLSFHPAIEGEMSSFFICGKAWGIYSQKEENGKMCKHIDVLYGTLDDIHVQE